MHETAIFTGVSNPPPLASMIHVIDFDACMHPTILQYTVHGYMYSSVVLGISCMHNNDQTVACMHGHDIIIVFVSPTF